MFAKMSLDIQLRAETEIRHENPLRVGNILFNFWEWP